MKCEAVESYMIDYLDNVLEKTLRDEIEQHLGTCERCLDQLKDFKQLLNVAGSAEMEQPDETLRVNFYHMLHGEMNKQIQATGKSVSLIPSFQKPAQFLKVAAGIALLIAGTIIGALLNNTMKNQDEKLQLSELKTEVQNMKEIVMLTMLKEESPSQRLQAVGYTNELQAPDSKVLDALTETLNHDKNVNVRLAAAYSLANYADRQSVRDSLVASLSQQSEPIIQVVLMNILVERKESNAITSIRRIISDEKTLKEVKEVAQKGLKVLL